MKTTLRTIKITISDEIDGEIFESSEISSIKHIEQSYLPAADIFMKSYDRLNLAVSNAMDEHGNQQRD